eukprot:scaffold5150_cov376-Prasinococcus_capsulatus_cf.AAC.11
MGNTASSSQPDEPSKVNDRRTDDRSTTPEASNARSFQLKVHLPTSNTTAEELQGLLKAYGKVISAEVYTSPRGTILVDFEDPDAVDEAVYNFQSSNRYGKTVKAKKQPAVRFTYESDGRHPQSALADEISKKHDVLKLKVTTDICQSFQCWSFFSQYGKIVYVDVNTENGGIVEFSDEASVDRASTSVLHVHFRARVANAKDSGLVVVLVQGLAESRQYKVQRLNLAKITSTTETDYCSPHGVLAGCRTFGKVRDSMFRFKQPFALLEFQGTIEGTKRAAAKLNRKGWSTIVYWRGSSVSSEAPAKAGSLTHVKMSDTSYMALDEEEGSARVIPRPRPNVSSPHKSRTGISSTESQADATTVERNKASASSDVGYARNEPSAALPPGQDGGSMEMPVGDTAVLSPTSPPVPGSRRGCTWNACMTRIPLSPTDFFEKVVLPTGAQAFFLMCLAGGSHAYLQYHSAEAYSSAAKFVKTAYSELGISKVTSIPKGELSIGVLGKNVEEDAVDVPEAMANLQRAKCLVYVQSHPKSQLEASRRWEHEIVPLLDSFSRVEFCQTYRRSNFVAYLSFYDGEDAETFGTS